MVNIKSFINFPVDSVTYLISNPENAEALVIDPGTQNDERITTHIKNNDLELNYIFLTHEHFDHILGVNFLRSRFQDVKVISSEKTSQRLTDPKKNLAIFHNQINLKVNKADVHIEEGFLDMLGLQFEVLATPGHTDSSISLKLGNSFFFGRFSFTGNQGCY